MSDALESDEIREAQIAIFIAKLKASSFNRNLAVKEAFDGPIEMIPVVYAMLEFLADSCIATGHDEWAWWQFLRDSLDECIAQSERKAFTDD
jgi:hypothetical protein